LIESSASNNSLPSSTLPSNASSNNFLPNNPEQLLSFLNASEKVLNTKEGVSDSAIVLNKKVEEEFKSDKTLIAQSITKQASDESSSITKEINELLKKEGHESTDSSTKNTVKTDGKYDLLNELVNDDKKQTSETKKVAAEENSDSKLNDKINNNKVTQEATLKANAETTTELTDKAIKLTPNQVTDIADKKTTVDSILAKQNVKNNENINEQSKPQVTNQTTEAIQEDEIIETLVKPKAQVVTQTTSQTDGKNVESKGEQKLVNSLPDPALEELIETTENEGFDDKIKSVTTNNIVPNKFDQSIDRNKKSSQEQSINKAPDITPSHSDDVTEVAIEAVKEELLSAELKPFNSNIKLNQSPNALFDSLAQREVSNRIDSESFIENELSFENVMQTMSSDLAQTQKNTVIQQVETISIMRKDFTDAVKEKVMVMINQKIQQIDIQLDPPELGSMQVRINMQNEQAVVSFVVQNQQAKEALDQNMDRLKHMMADNGVDVGDANVRQESNQSAMNNQNDQDSSGQRDNGEDGSLEGAMNTEHAKVLKASSTGVDYYV